MGLNVTAASVNIADVLLFSDGFVLCLNDRKENGGDV